MSVYRDDRMAAAQFAEKRAAQANDSLQEWNLRHGANDRKDYGTAFSALVYGLKQAVRASPDFLSQIDVDAAASMILDRWPPSSGVSF